MRHVGDAVRDYSAGGGTIGVGLDGSSGDEKIVSIGVATWGIIQRKERLVGEGGQVSYDTKNMVVVAVVLVGVVGVVVGVVLLCIPTIIPLNIRVNGLPYTAARSLTSQEFLHSILTTPTSFSSMTGQR